MDKFAGETYVKSDASYDGYYKNKNCNRSQIKVSQDVYVPMEGHIYSDRLENGTYENDGVFCNACYAYRHDDFKRLYSDLSQDIYVPIEIAYNFMNRLSYGTYENGNVFCIHVVITKTIIAKDYKEICQRTHMSLWMPAAVFLMRSQ